MISHDKMRFTAPIILFFIPFILFSQMIINEIDSDTPGSDTMEFIELYDGGSGNSSLDGLVIVLFNGSDDASYNKAYDLDGQSTNHEGFFVLGNANVPNADSIVSNGFLQNGPDAVALYYGNSDDFPNNTPVHTNNLIDAIVYDTKDADDDALLVLLNAGQPQVDEDGKGEKTNHSLQRYPNGTGGFRNTETYQPRIPTPGINNGEGAVGVEIFEVQGNGMTSPLHGQNVRLENNIVTGVTSDGFYIQTPDVRADADTLTSNGVFVYTENPPALQIGDQVHVTGDVDEFYESTQISNVSDIQTVTPAYALPASIDFDESRPTSGQPWPEDELERYENMLVRVKRATVCSPMDKYGEVKIVAADQRTFKGPGILYPGRTGLPVWDGNPEIFEMHLTGLGLPQKNLFGGCKIDSAKGVLAFRFGDYQLLPDTLMISCEDTLIPIENPSPSQFTVATQNAERLFDDVNDPLKDDDLPGTDNMNLKMNKLALQIIDILQKPDIIALQEVENLSILRDLAANIQGRDPSAIYTAYLEDGNDISGIDVGFLIKNSMTIDSVFQMNKNETFVHNSIIYTLHDRPPLLVYAHPQSNADFQMVILNLHIRSLLGIEGSDSLRVRQKRLAQSISIAGIVQNLQEDNPDIKLMITGDFNAFEFTDGYVDVLGQITGTLDPAGAQFQGADIVHPDLHNGILDLPESERYSYIYDGNAQCLDHMLASSSIQTDVNGLAFTRGNADAPKTHKYIPNSPSRCSDHDGLVAYIDVPPSSSIQQSHELTHNMPTSFQLKNYPNPFNHSTQIHVELPVSGLTQICVLDVQGRHIHTLHHGFLKKGYHELSWHGSDEKNRDVSSGIYFIKIRSNRTEKIIKCMLLK